MENTKAQKVKMYDMEMEFEIDLKDMLGHFYNELET